MNIKVNAMSKYVMVTGASSGIGYETAKAFAKRGYNPIILARRTEKLEKLKQEVLGLNPCADVVIISSDLSKDGEPERVYEFVKKYDIETWINNAGLGNSGDLRNAEPEHNKRMLRVNTEALGLFSAMFVADNYNKDGAQLINIASVGGYINVPGCAFYCATKFFVTTLTEQIWDDMNRGGYKLKAKVMAPKTTETEFEQSCHESETPFDYSSRSGKYNTAEEMAEFIWQLHEGDKPVGEIDGNMNLVLTDRKIPHI